MKNILNSRKQFWFAVLLMLAFHLKGYAQHKSETSFGGFGFGLDYGGIGLKVEHLPIKELGLFAGAGYNLAGIGWNAGINYKILPESTVTPFLSFMYGYNAVLLLKYGSVTADKKTYYGFTPGGGVDAFLGKSGKQKLSFTLFVPIRNKEFRQRATKSIPVAVSAGLNIKF